MQLARLWCVNFSLCFACSRYRFRLMIGEGRLLGPSGKFVVTMPEFAMFNLLASTELIKSPPQVKSFFRLSNWTYWRHKCYLDYRKHVLVRNVLVIRRKF